MCKRRFETFDELLNLLKRGGEVVLKHDGTEFTLLPNFEEGHDGPVSVSVAVWHEISFDNVGDFIIKDYCIKDIAAESEVVFRPDK